MAFLPFVFVVNASTCWAAFYELVVRYDALECAATHESLMSAFVVLQLPTHALYCCLFCFVLFSSLANVFAGLFVPFIKSCCFNALYACLFFIKRASINQVINRLAGVITIFLLKL